jgi:hypothetical protein
MLSEETLSYAIRGEIAKHLSPGWHCETQPNVVGGDLHISGRDRV